MLRECTWGGAPASLTAGTYVISVMYLFGSWDLMTTDIFWGNRNNQKTYRNFYEILARPLPENASQKEHHQRQLFMEDMQRLQSALLVNRLSRRLPDERIGYSLFVYRLTQEQVDGLISP